MLSGCASRKIVTAVEDQSTVQRAAPEVPAPVAAATVSPQIPTEPPKAEPAPQIEPAPAQPEPARIEKPTVPPVAEEALAMEQPPTPAPTPSPQPAVQPAQPMAALADVFFDFDRFTVRSDAQPVLEANAGVLKLQSDQQIVIEGHCDERGTSAYNLVLGERRAQSARNYLQVLGVPPSQIRITSYGKERPFCTEHSEACWQSNRRAHFRRP
jgi:peptidoglycan-associated lipoprotein